MKRILVEAGAGCGKTYSIVEKFLNACASKKSGGENFSPSDILLLTFTEAAAREMRGRILEQAPDIDLERGYVGTFHGYCLKLLKQDESVYAGEYGDIYSEEEVAILIRKQFLNLLAQNLRLPDLLSALSLPSLMDLALKGEDSTRSVEEEFNQLRNTWETFRAGLLRKLNSLDLDELNETDWPHQALKLLEERDLSADIGFSVKKLLKAIAEKDPGLFISVKRLRELQRKGIYTSLIEAWDTEEKILIFIQDEIKKMREQLPRLFTFAEMERLALHGLRENKIKIPELKLIIVDEFQDTSPAQWEMVQILSQKDTEWFLVGDPKQSIYAFRKADTNLYTELKKTLQVLSLEKNFRSAREVLAVTNSLQEKLFAAPGDPTPQNLQPGKEVTPLPRPVIVHECEEEISSATVWAAIQNREAGGSDKIHHAVLFREWKKLYEFAEWLNKNEIPYFIGGADNFLNHFLSKTFSEFIQGVFNAPSNRLDPLRSLGIDVTAEQQKYFSQSRDVLQAFFVFSEQVQPARWPLGAEWAAATERFLFGRYKKGFTHWQNILQLLKNAYLEEKLSLPILDLGPSLKLTLMTIHGSKGLEFDAVYLPNPRERAQAQFGMEDDEVDFRFAVTPQQKSRSLYFELRKADRKIRSEAEQKRLFYVALTRAKRSLDFFLPLKEGKKARAVEPVWSEIWLPNSGLEPFRWSTVVESLRGDNRVEWSSEQHVPATEEDFTLLIPRGRKPLRKHLLAERKLAPSAAQDWGTQLHGALEIWDGSEASLQKIVGASQNANPTQIEAALRAVKAHADLKLYWQQVQSPTGDWKLFREEDLLHFALPEESNEESSEEFNRADVLILGRDEVFIIDWKTADAEKNFTPERLQNINSQLTLYGETFRNKVAKINLMAVGIFPAANNHFATKTLINRLL